MSEVSFDALIVGAGFGGIYQLHKLRSAGLSACVIDVAKDVGGTWYWNRYPGAMSDTESYVYRYSWDTKDLQTYPWSHHYVKQAEVLEYLRHVVEKYDLRKDMRLGTEMRGATWDEDSQVWRVELSDGATLTIRYLITALGLLSKANFPDIPGLTTFAGGIYHTAQWTSEIALSGKRVGVIGCGSTGIQVITDIADKVGRLVCFQRHPQYSVPSGDREVSPEYRRKVNESYPQIMRQVRNSICGFGFTESETPFHSVSPKDRERIFEELWNQGNGFRFMFGGFCDISTNREANEAACEFIRKKISSIVQDPEKARKLTPHDYYARRPLCDGGYYRQFNRDNVDIVDLKESPISAIEPSGIRLQNGTLHELDLIIFATGFDAIDGNYNRLRIRGKNSKTLVDHWATSGPTSYLGVFVPDFPNLFMITGPQGPFCNIPPAIEVHVELISDTILRAEQSRRTLDPGAVVEALPAAEKAWGAACEQAVDGSLFKETASWIFGNNVAGKTIATRFYFGGLAKFIAVVEDMVGHDFKGLKPLPVGYNAPRANGLEQDSAYVASICVPRR